MATPDITLYGSIYSRTFTARWILGEIGLPYRLVEVDISRNEQKAPAYLKINPMGKVPAIMDHGVVVTETAAICLYLADRYSYGTLAPTIDDPMRGAYCRWLVYAVSVLEPGILHGKKNDPNNGRGVAWGTYETVIDVAEQALTPGPFLLGERFSAADVEFWRGDLFLVVQQTDPRASRLRGLQRTHHGSPRIRRRRGAELAPARTNIPNRLTHASTRASGTIGDELLPRCGSPIAARPADDERQTRCRSVRQRRHAAPTGKI